jgi:hypothetical protein
VVIAIFAVAMLRVTTLKIRKLSCTRNFLQLYAALHGLEVPAPQPTEILEDASTNSSDSGGDFFVSDTVTLTHLDNT